VSEIRMCLGLYLNGAQNLSFLSVRQRSTLCQPTSGKPYPTYQTFLVSDLQMSHQKPLTSAAAHSYETDNAYRSTGLIDRDFTGQTAYETNSDMSRAFFAPSFIC
jgi:hypothetical protein